MKIISDYINKKTEILNEAVQERHILKFIKQLSSMGYNLTDVFGESPNFKISDMDGTRVKEYNYVDQSVLNDVKKKIKNGGYMFWGILDDKVTIISLNSYYLIFVPVEKKNDIIPSSIPEPKEILPQISKLSSDTGGISKEDFRKQIQARKNK